MKVILTKDVPSLGRAGDIKNVSDGYARNFLILKHLALPASSEALMHMQKVEQEQQGRVKKLQDQAEKNKNIIENKIFTVTVRDSGVHKLYAAIREKEIAQILTEKLHLSIEPKQVIIKETILTLGQHSVEIKLTESIHAHAKIEVKKQT